MLKLNTKKYSLFILIGLSLAGAGMFFRHKLVVDDLFVSYRVNPKTQHLKLYWKDDAGQAFRSIGNLKNWLNKNKTVLLFAMNAGMYKPDGSPQGLFIENGKTVAPLDTTSGNGNFYLKPTGVFYITVDGVASISSTTEFMSDGRMKYATQSGPMLVMNGQIHTAFTPGSSNINIRNGVGILPDSTILFAMSKDEMNFFDFAEFFKNKGCKNALYLDGLVSRTYLPEKNWLQTDGDFGVIIGVAVEEKE